LAPSAIARPSQPTPAITTPTMSNVHSIFIVPPFAETLQLQTDQRHNLHGDPFCTAFLLYVTTAFSP
jgi:hypothetical protein